MKVMGERSRLTANNHSQITDSNCGWFKRTDEKISESLTYVHSFTPAEHFLNQTTYLPSTYYIVYELETQLLGYHLWHVSILYVKLDCTTYIIITRFQN